MHNYKPLAKDGDWAPYAKEGNEELLAKEGNWAVYPKKGNCEPLALEGDWTATANIEGHFEAYAAPLFAHVVMVMANIQAIDDSFDRCSPPQATGLPPTELTPPAQPPLKFSVPPAHAQRNLPVPPSR
jgi:hypothetical protein